MKKLLFIIAFLSTSAFGIDKPIPCEGASCKLKFETRDGSNVKVNAGEVSGNVWTFFGGLKPSSGSSTLTVLETGSSWTPALSFSGGNGTASTSTALGRYVRINNMVCFSGAIAFAKGTASGALGIIGLPATAGGVSYTGVSIHVDTGVSFGSPRAYVQAYVPSGTSKIQPTFGVNNGTGALNLDASDLAVGGTSLFFSGCYPTS